MCVCVCVRACVRACVCVCVCVSSTSKTLVCASSKDSRESVRSLDFYNSSKSIYFTLITCIVKKKRNTYKMYMKI